MYSSALDKWYKKGRKKTTEPSITRGEAYKASFLFIRDVCKVATNCGCGCPFSTRIKDNSFNGCHYDCKINAITDDNVVETVAQNVDFLQKNGISIQ